MHIPTPEEEEKEQEILRVARRLARNQRTAFLEQRCGGDVALRQRIELMLAVVGHADALPKLPTDRLGEGDSHIEGPGSTIGSYRLLERLGEGGFGVVFLAEQVEPIRRRVALKLIKPGMDTNQVVVRFEAERQALALMEHENIARVLDGGETASGRPYFVMELVRGVPITKHCDQVHLTVPERLELFATVCDAVQHAHQKGIIHRDLKPSNILVATADGKATVKVIDFGVAKAIGQQLTEKTLLTGYQMIGTPLYMSPEQAELGGLDADTRADVFALGVILYELMTGTTPVDRERMKSASFDEVRRLIREEEPPKPSTRVGTHGDTSTISQNRSSDPLRLRRLLHGELDWIVMKCLEKDRTRRYESASSLAQDVRRFLASEPVQAGPPSARYRLRKLFARHRAAVLTAALLLLVLLVGIVGTTAGLIRADRQRARAVAAEGETRVQRDRAVAAADSAQKRLAQIERGVDVLASIFEDLAPNTLDREDRTLREVLGKRLENAARQLEGEAIGDPLIVARLQRKLGDSLISLGYAERAGELLTKARATFLEALGDGDHETIACTVSLAYAHCWMGDLDVALPLGEEALRLAQENLEPDDPDTIHCLSALGLIHSHLGQMERALPLFEEALALRKQVLGPEDPDTILALANLAGAYLEAGKIEPAIAAAQQAIELAERTHGKDHSTVLAAMNTLVSAYHTSGRLSLALPLQEDLWKRALTKLGPDHPWTRVFLGNLGAGYLSAGKLEQAAPMLERAAEYVERIGFEGESASTILDNLEDCLQRLQRFDEAEQWRRKVVAAQKRRDAHSLAYADALAALARNVMRQSQWSAAAPVLLECVEVLKAQVEKPASSLDAPGTKVPDSAPDADEARDGARAKAAASLLAAMQQLVRLYTAWGNSSEADRWRQEIEAAQARSR